MEKFILIKRNIFRIILIVFAIIGFIFSSVFVALSFGWTNVNGSVSERNTYFNLDNKINTGVETRYDWQDSDEWKLMKEVFERDQDMIKQAANDAGVSPRLILSGVIGEQFRFFGNRRESFKKYFEPLKILASLSNISYGIAGLKPKTAALIEEHLHDANSPYYLGPEMENLITYEEDDDIDSVRMSRITETKNPYYPYLYIGLYMKQIIRQWERKGYDIENRPEIIATLYNLGFYYSNPKPNPQAGGAVINIGGKEYIFGDLAHQFYYSTELSETFPIVVQ